jgi:hypothetical protein
MNEYQLAGVAAFWMLLLGGSNAFADTYYVDCAGGSDANAGSSRTAAWLHHPYRVGFTGEYTHSAGDQFYFKGGETCPYSYFPLTVASGGSSSTSDYYGPDPTHSWYTGSAWSRPIFGMSGHTVGGDNNVFIFGNTSYVWVDDFEITAFADSGDAVYGHNIVFLDDADHNTITNNYMHAWVANLSGHDDLWFIGGCNACSGGNQGNTLIEYNYMNGSDATPPATSDRNASGQAIKYIDGGTIAYNVFHNVSNCYIGGSNLGATIHDNDCGFVYLSFDSTNHENMWEHQIDGNVIYNNLYHHTTSVGV